MTAHDVNPPIPHPDYFAHYMRLAEERRRFTRSNQPLGPGLGRDDGRKGGMHDANFQAGGPSRRELEIAAWLTRDVPPELADAQFDIATLLMALEAERYGHDLATRNMLEAEHRAHVAEHEGALGELASRYAMLQFAAEQLERQNTMLRAAQDLCAREHCGHPAGSTTT